MGAPTGITAPIGDAELGQTGVITADPVLGDLSGLLPKFRQADEDNLADLEEQYDDLEAHDHSGANNGGQLGEVLPGGGTTRADSFGDGSIVKEKIADSAVTGSKTAAGAITTVKVASQTMDKTKLGDATAQVLTAGSAGSAFTWNHGLGRYVKGHIEGYGTDENRWLAQGISVLKHTTTSVQFFNNTSVAGATFVFRYR